MRPVCLSLGVLLLKMRSGNHKFAVCLLGDLEFVTLVNSVELLSQVRLFATPWTAAHQASLSITNSQSLLKLMSIESVMPSNHLLLASISPSIRAFSSESGWMKHKLESRLQGEISITSDMQMTPLLWQKEKKN